MASSHNNTISIACNDITNVDLDTHSIQIPSGQPFESAGVSRSSSGVWSITLDCGRSGSGSIAENYVQLTGGQYNMFVEASYANASATHSDVPRSLNFLFEATLFFGSHGVPLYFGQGSVGTVNYWWIGGPMILNSCPNQSPMAYLISPSTNLYEVRFYNDKVDQLTISPMAS